MKGRKLLTSKKRQGRCRIVKSRQGRVGEQLLHSGPRNQAKMPGNYDQTGVWNIPCSIGIFIPNNVTVSLMTIANRGRTVAAGVVFGACVSAGDSKAVVWESVLSRTGQHWPAKFAARQWRFVASFGWCRELNAGRKKRRVNLSEKTKQIMSERMIPGGVLRSDAKRFGLWPKGYPGTPIISVPQYWNVGRGQEIHLPACLKRIA